MTKGVTARAREFGRNFPKYRDLAINAKIINVTRHGCVIGAFLSASELVRYEAMKRREREVLVVGELDEPTVSAIEAAEYGVVAG